jgi:hypothetical protein
MTGAIILCEQEKCRTPYEDDYSILLVWDDVSRKRKKTFIFDGKVDR